MILLDGFEAGRSRVLEVILNEFQMNCRHDALGTRLWRSGFHNKLDSLPCGETSGFAGGLVKFDSSGTGPHPSGSLAPFPLTLTLSLREREQRAPRSGKSRCLDCSPRREWFTLSPRARAWV